VKVPIFPKLTSLLLEMLDFSTEVPGLGVLFDFILSAVEQRKAKKTPLTTLCIDRCIISAEEAGELEKVVPDFWWDHEGDHEREGDFDYRQKWILKKKKDYDYNGFVYDGDDLVPIDPSRIF